MHIQNTDRAERSMRALLFLALMLGVGWAMTDGGTARPLAGVAGVFAGR